jgi:branched-subunit amino acid ABC-type transport system permease component
MEFFIISMLNGLSYGLLLFMLSSGLTLIFSMMGVLNFAHASFYMVGAYMGYTLTRWWVSGRRCSRARWLVGLLGALFERLSLRKVHKFGHVPELLVTFGLSYIILELVQLVWGRTAVEFRPPEVLRGPPSPWSATPRQHGLGLGPQRRPRCAARRHRPSARRSRHPRLHDAGGGGDAGSACGCCSPAPGSGW